ncbi:hypothetical protein [Hymenobacter nivis]|uniref:Uncharacterized protein n=1 Tax=Hymenobacter nivis TaxID=1850093 RepID=A0A502HB95_9BACT|nr:hypothetical protein [Hymenobacter nivis]TPG71917.1 hypothetical protein EAH73_01315 [Hymenobacter nivis]
MKKVLLSITLALTALGAWAIYPQAAAPKGYLMLVGSGRPGTTGAPELTTVWPDGRREVQSLRTIKTGTERSSTSAAVDLHQAEVVKLNALYNQQWRLVSVAQSTVGVGATTETIYLLEKR